MPTLAHGGQVTSGIAAVRTAVPFVKPVASSGKAKAEGGAVEVSLADITRGATRTVEWRCKPVWVVHLTPEMIKELQGHIDELADPDSQRDQQPPYAQNATHSIKPEFFIVIDICTHLGGSPSTAPMRTANPSLPTD